MSVVHTGSTKQYAAGWDAIFSSRKASRTATKPTATRSRKPAAKKASVSAKRGKSRSR